MEENIDTPGKRLNLARTKRDVTVGQISKATKQSISTINAHQNGQNGIKPKIAQRYEDYMILPTGYILYGIGAEEVEKMCSLNDLLNLNKSEAPDIDVETYIIDGIAQAGGEVHRDITNTQIEPEIFSKKYHKNIKTIRIDGESMYPRFKDRELVEFGSPSDAIDELINREALVSLEDGRELVKIVIKGSQEGLYTLLSYHPSYKPIEDVKIASGRPFNKLIGY